MQLRFGSAGYAMEELRAELASAFIAAELGIPTDIPLHASYIANWIKPLEEDFIRILRPRLPSSRLLPRRVLRAYRHPPRDQAE
jgi:antirestriction protein ArdC